jgi:NAD-dependent deacetylase
LDSSVTKAAEEVISQADLFISVGTSGVVWPASMYPQIAQSAQAYCVEVNPEPTTQSHLFHVCYRQLAGVALPQLFPGVILS